jgi:hypothetical protein
MKKPARALLYVARTYARGSNAETFRRPELGFHGLDPTIPRRRVGDERVDQLARNSGHLLHRAVEAA